MLAASTQFGWAAALEIWGNLYEPMISAIKEEPQIEVLACQLSALNEALEVLEEKGLNDQVLTACTEVVSEVLGDYEER